MFNIILAFKDAQKFPHRVKPGKDEHAVRDEKGRSFSYCYKSYLKTCNYIVLQYLIKMYNRKNKMERKEKGNKHHTFD